MSVSSIDESSAGEPPARRTVGSWWSEFAQSTERWTMGMSMTAMTPKTAARVARREKSVDSERSSRYPTYITNMIAVVTRRGSHVHHTPHVGFAQIEPATRKRPVKSTPISADETAIASNRGFFVQSQPTEARNTTTKARYASHARGTWTY